MKSKSKEKQKELNEKEITDFIMINIYFSGCYTS